MQFIWDMDLRIYYINWWSTFWNSFCIFSLTEEGLKTTHRARFVFFWCISINKKHTNKNMHKHHTSLKCDDWASFVSPLIPFPRKENITKCNLNLDKKSSSNNQGFGLKMTYTKPCESFLRLHCSSRIQFHVPSGRASLEISQWQIEWSTDSWFITAGGSFSNTLRGPFSNTDHCKLRFDCQGQHFGPQEA